MAVAALVHVADTNVGQLLITVYNPTGRVTVAYRETPGKTWGPPVEAHFNHIIPDQEPADVA